MALTTPTHQLGTATYLQLTPEQEQYLSEFRDIPGLEGQYAINRIGEVWSYKRQRLLRHQTNQQTGYKWVRITHTTACDFIHNLILQTFVGPNPNPSEVKAHWRHKHPPRPVINQGLPHYANQTYVPLYLNNTLLNLFWGPRKLRIIQKHGNTAAPLSSLQDLGLNPHDLAPIAADAPLPSHANLSINEAYLFLVQCSLEGARREQELRGRLLGVSGYYQATFHRGPTSPQPQTLVDALRAKTEATDLALILEDPELRKQLLHLLQALDKQQQAGSTAQTHADRGGGSSLRPTDPARNVATATTGGSSGRPLTPREIEAQNADQMQRALGFLHPKPKPKDKEEEEEVNK